MKGVVWIFDEAAGSLSGSAASLECSERRGRRLLIGRAWALARLIFRGVMANFQSF